MEIHEDQLDRATLLALSAQAIELLCAGEFDGLAKRFPYAVAFGRPPAVAIAMDLASELSKAPGLEASMRPANGHYRVGYFESNDVTLHASVDWRVVSPSGDTLVVDMVVIGNGRMDLALEGIVVLPADAD